MYCPGAHGESREVWVAGNVDRRCCRMMREVRIPPFTERGPLRSGDPGGPWTVSERERPCQLIWSTIVICDQARPLKGTDTRVSHDEGTSRSRTGCRMASGLQRGMRRVAAHSASKTACKKLVPFKNSVFLQFPLLSSPMMHLIYCWCVGYVWFPNMVMV